MARPDTVACFDQWAATYDHGVFQPVLCHTVHRAVLDHITRCPPPPRRILDIGCGTGALLAAIARRLPHATLIGVDLAAGMLTVAAAKRPTIPLARAAAEHLPFSDDTFDLATCALTWRHLTNQQTTAAEITRVLHPGGLLILADVFTTRRRTRIRRQRLAPEAVDAAATLSAAGLTVTTNQPTAGVGPAAEVTILTALRPG